MVTSSSSSHDPSRSTFGGQSGAGDPRDPRRRRLWGRVPGGCAHPAPHAAAASILAHDQGKFWAMHDRLFANQQALSDEELAAHAKAVGVDVADFAKAMRQPEVSARIEADVKLAQDLGLQGTPTVYINGIQMMGAQPYEAFAEIINAQLVQAGALRDASGTKGEELYELLVETNEP
ncbi:MAG: DsbA family protein [Gemmatimonadaceae bacterium]